MTLCRIKITGLKEAEQSAKEILAYCESIRVLQRTLSYNSIKIETDLDVGEEEEQE